MVSITDHAKGDYSNFINILKKLSTTNRCLLECPHKKQNTDRSMNHGSTVWCVSGPPWTESMLKGMGPYFLFYSSEVKRQESVDMSS